MPETHYARKRSKKETPGGTVQTVCRGVDAKGVAQTKGKALHQKSLRQAHGVECADTDCKEAKTVEAAKKAKRVSDAQQETPMASRRAAPFSSGEDNVKAWFDKYASTKEWLRQKSIEPGTLSSYRLAMIPYCEWRGTDPDGLAEEVGSLGRDMALKGVQGQLSDYQEHLKTVRLENGTGYAQGTIKLHVTALKSFYSVVFGHKIIAKLRVNANVRKNETHIPNRLELRRILDTCDLRGKTLTLFQATTGMRVGDMVSLRVKDVEPALSDDTEFFPVWYTPQKNGKSTGRIFTLLPPCATALLRQYLRLRQTEGEEFGPETPAFVSNRNDGTPISTGQVNYHFKKAVKAAGILSDMEARAGVKLSDKGLRSYFFNTLEGAGMQRRIVQYMGAHTVEYISAYQRITVEQATEEYRRHLGSIDPFYDEEKEAAVRRAESLENEMETLKERMDKLETGQYAKQLVQELSGIRDGSCEGEIVSDSRKLERCIAEGCFFMFPIGEDRYFVCKKGVKQDG